MRTSDGGEVETQTGQRRAGPRPGEETLVGPEILTGLKNLELARDRLLAAAMAFSDGEITAQQLRAVREFYREQISLATDRQPGAPSRRSGHSPAPEPVPEPQAPVAAPVEPRQEVRLAEEAGEEIGEQLAGLERKMARLEQDFALGNINPTQYKAVRRHYHEQRDVALKLHASNPSSERWRIVLEEGKTVFLLQLNEAACLGFAIYDTQSRSRVFLEGSMGRSAEEAMALLGTFGPPTASGTGRMLATRTDDGDSLLLIPGQHTVALVRFTSDPPGWQVAPCEVHHLPPPSCSGSPWSSPTSAGSSSRPDPRHPAGRQAPPYCPQRPRPRLWPGSINAGCGNAPSPPTQCPKARRQSPQAWAAKIPDWGLLVAFRGPASVRRDDDASISPAAFSHLDTRRPRPRYNRRPAPTGGSA
jgi:hypothetical protein